ncbi:MAG: lamin tail domain-containing protein [Verrucomicrobiota bacterium]
MLASLTSGESARADQTIYTDSIQNGWQDWSWATHNINNTTPTHTGSRSISVNADAWTAVSFWHSAQTASAFTSFSFWIHGGTSGGQSLQLYAETANGTLPGVALPAPVANTWQQITIPLASLGLAGATNMTRFSIQNASGNTLPIFYLDDVSLISDSTPPVVQSFSPPAGTVSALTNLSVIFSETVTGVGASDLRINGNPALTMSGSGSNYTFTFAQPPEGVVNITWATGHGITDLSLPANAFNATGPGATWQYTMLDSIPPTIATLYPSGGATIATLGQIEVTFSETVLGVQAADLLINGAPATNVIKLVGQPYIFQFPPPPTGAVFVAWATNHGITDGAAAANGFTGGAWNYTLNPNLTLPDLVINEILCANVKTNGLADEDGAQEDWIEIYNRGTQPVTLANWSLSDDPALPGLWTFPARTLNPGQYLIVFASGKDRRPTSTSSNLHTNFKLANSGETLGLYSTDSPRQLVSGFNPYPEQRNDTSYGLDLLGALRYFATPTPGAANGMSTTLGIVDPVHVNAQRGHYTSPFTLTASCPTPGAVLRYTTDGAEPTANSAVFLGSLQITNTTLFRIAAFKTNYLPAQCVTRSYLFNLPAAFRSLPVISIVTASNNLWGPNGIMGFGQGYRNIEQHGSAWEKPISLEWIKPTDDSGFQVDCGIRIQGSDYNRDNSNENSKFSFRIYFRSDYGPGRLNYPLFANTSVESFDGLVLRAGFNEQENPFIRDELHRRLSADMGQLAAHGNMAIVLLNGNYYTNTSAPQLLPVYNPTERVHAEFFQEYLGGSDAWDVVKPPWQEGGGAVDGTFANMQALVDYVYYTADVTQSTDYNTISAWLDLTNFVDYLVLNTYAGMGDWPANNWRAGRDQAGGPWRFVLWDAEWGMGIYGRSPTGINNFTDTGAGLRQRRRRNRPPVSPLEEQRRVPLALGRSGAKTFLQWRCLDRGKHHQSLPRTGNRTRADHSQHELQHPSMGS